jgi:hypothetical protein
MLEHRGEERKMYKVWLGKSEGKRPRGRPREWGMGSKWNLG